MMIFLIFGQFMNIYLLSFFNFLICFKCQMTIEWLMLSSLATSNAVVRELASVIALNWSLSTFDSQPPCPSSSRLSSPLQNFLSHQYSKFVSSSWAQFVVDVVSVSSVLQPVLNLNKKIAQIYFLSNVISIVSNKYKIKSK